jgi:hypothetical protein
VRFELGRQIFLAERVFVEVGDKRDEIDDLITLQAPRIVGGHVARMRSKGEPAVTRSMARVMRGCA